VLTTFVNGGPLMFAILGLSVIALAIFLERAAFLCIKLKMNMDSAFQLVMHPLERRNFREAVDICSKMKDHPLGGILKAGILKADRRDKDIERAMEEQLMSESSRLKSRINLLKRICPPLKEKLKSPVSKHSKRIKLKILILSTCFLPSMYY